MSLFEQLFESAVERSRSIKKLATLLLKVVTDVADTKVALGEVMSIVSKHNEAIQAIYANQSALADALKASSLDSQLPSIDKDKAQKPN